MIVKSAPPVAKKGNQPVVLPGDTPLDQLDASKVPPEDRHAPFGDSLVAVLKPDEEIVGIAHDDHIARGGLGPPLPNPQVEEPSSETVQEYQRLLASVRDAERQPAAV